MTREGLQPKIEKLMDVERARAVLLVEVMVLRLVDFPVENALLHQELRPLEVAVPGEQGVVEIEQGKAHDERSGRPAVSIWRGGNRAKMRPRSIT